MTISNEGGHFEYARREPTGDIHNDLKPGSASIILGMRADTGEDNDHLTRASESGRTYELDPGIVRSELTPEQVLAATERVYEDKAK